jgi:hypothetical protein
VELIDVTRSIERQQFFEGQRLFASDLQAIETFNREMRWLHNQSLHQPGIGNGLAVSGSKGDRELLVGPGYAIDDLGREVVLASSRTVPVPPVADDGFGEPQRFVLTVQYPEDEDLEDVERRQGICDTSGAVRLREEPIFCWVKLNPDGSASVDQERIVTGRQLVLAEAAVRDCKLAREISIVQRRNARPPVQPYIACGSAVPTPWEPWDGWPDLLQSPAGQAFSVNRYETYSIVGGIQADVDTRRAGFHATPDYFARIDGPRLITVDISNEQGMFVADGLLSIVEPTASGFTAQVIVLAFDVETAFVGPSELTRRSTRRPTRADTILGGFDMSALHGEPFVLHESAAPTPGAEARPDTTGAEVFRDWTVGWMGFEG